MALSRDFVLSTILNGDAIGTKVSGHYSDVRAKLTGKHFTEVSWILLGDDTIAAFKIILWLYRQSSRNRLTRGSLKTSKERD